MFVGHALGDALGAPHEFRYHTASYTGVLEHHTERLNRWTGARTKLALGQCTDDTEMTLALRSSIVENVYDEERAIAAYLEWANSGCPFMGTNTRELFKGVTTIRGYRNRVKKRDMMKSQSNGCLMRCCPLALVDNWEEAVVQDCSLTNPHPICVEACSVYIVGLRAALNGGNVREAMLDRMSSQLKEELEAPHRDIKTNKGFILNALWLVWRYIDSPSYRGAIDEVIQMGGDTDTNAAIVGAMVGARLGLEAMMKDDLTASNVEVMMNCDTSSGDYPRPLKYHPKMYVDED